MRLSCLGCFGTIMLVVFAICRCSCGGCSGKDDAVKAEQRIVHLNDTLTNALVDVPELHDMDSIMRRYLKRWELNGAQLAVTRNDSLLYVKGYGWADKERNVLMEPCHIMRMASVSKLVTAVGIMKLQEMGRLKLSDKVFGRREYSTTRPTSTPYATSVTTTSPSNSCSATRQDSTTTPATPCRPRAIS